MAAIRPSENDAVTSGKVALEAILSIGVTIFLEGIHKDVPKAYIYLPMGFALLVEVLQMRYEFNKQRRLEGS